MSSIARNEGESFAAYKERREEDNYQTQQALKPKMFWDSYMRGVYVNDKKKSYNSLKKAIGSKRQFKKHTRAD